KPWACTTPGSKPVLPSPATSVVSTIRYACILRSTVCLRTTTPKDRSKLCSPCLYGFRWWGTSSALISCRFLDNRKRFSLGTHCLQFIGAGLGQSLIADVLFPLVALLGKQRHGLLNQRAQDVVGAESE